jgi:hypothetical protein
MVKARTFVKEETNLSRQFVSPEQVLKNRRQEIETSFGEFFREFFSTQRKRPVRTRMQGVVGRAGEKPALTRLGEFIFDEIPRGLEQFPELFVSAKTMS